MNKNRKKKKKLHESEHRGEEATDQEKQNINKLSSIQISSSSTAAYKLKPWNDTNKKSHPT